ncbi:MAG: Rrf2 family transcriptional regulator [Clostridia bacterium]|nr:Rrf2 family transcriptional regulator [Clostridia bacterium]
MKLSTRARYGLKAMVDLAMCYGLQGCMSISALAQQQGISESYLEQIVASLRRAGYVISARGAQGGYSLALDPAGITVYDIFAVLEDTTLVDCVSTKEVNCSNACTCSARPLWLRLQSRIDDVLQHTTLKDLADDYNTQMERIKNE